MANIYNMIESDDTIKFVKFYGESDIETYHFLNFLLDKSDEIISYFRNNCVSIDTFDQYIDYLFLTKSICYREIVYKIALEEKRDQFVNMLKYLNDIYEKYNNGFVIKFINNNIKEIFTNNEEYYDIDEVTVEQCARFPMQISDDVFLFLAKEYPYLLIMFYSRLQNRIEKSQNVIIGLFTSILDSDENKRDLNAMLDILLSIRQRNTKLYTALGCFIDSVITLGKSIAQKVTKDNVIYYEKQFNEILSFLKKVKNPVANEFNEYRHIMDDLLREYLQENGTVLSYDLPTEKIKEMFESDAPWVIKIIQITHSVSHDKSSFICNLDRKPTDEFHIEDLASVNIPVNQYFTFSHQKNLEIMLAVGCSTVNLMLSKKDFFEKSMNCIYNQICNICEKASCLSENIAQDFQLLMQMLFNIYHDNISENDDKLLYHSLCYGASIYICSFIEKLLRSIYISITRKDSYISAKDVTLRSLLFNTNNPLTELIGEYQLRHLKYFLCTEKDDVEIGHNIRNRLAHLSEITMTEFTSTLVTKLFYLLISIINSLYLYYNLNTTDD